jgi:hypothetical protein
MRATWASQMGDIVDRLPAAAGQPTREATAMDALFLALAVLTALVGLDLLALRYGVSSRDGQREVWW